MKLSISDVATARPDIALLRRKSVVPWSYYRGDRTELRSWEGIRDSVAVFFTKVAAQQPALLVKSLWRSTTRFWLHGP